MKYKDNTCYGCEVCRNCGRDKMEYVYVCDECGDVGYEADFLEEHEGKELCKWCLEKAEEDEEGRENDG